MALEVIVIVCFVFVALLAYLVASRIGSVRTIRSHQRRNPRGYGHVSNSGGGAWFGGFGDGGGGDCGSGGDGGGGGGDCG